MKTDIQKRGVRISVRFNWNNTSFNVGFCKQGNKRLGTSRAENVLNN
jgi:hypothetical protein